MPHYVGTHRSKWIFTPVLRQFTGGFYQRSDMVRFNSFRAFLWRWYPGCFALESGDQLGDSSVVLGRSLARDSEGADDGLLDRLMVGVRPQRRVKEGS